MSQYLWDRKWRIQVVTGTAKDANGNATGEEIALDVSELECKFEVHKKRGQGGCYAICNIYNLTAESETKLINEGDRLIIEAGYNGITGQNELHDLNGNIWKGAPTMKNEEQTDEATATVQTPPARYGKIFDGKITWSSRKKESNVDYVLTIMAIDGDDCLNLNYISKTVNRGLNQRQILNTVCTGAEIQTPTNTVTTGLSDQQLPRGKVFFGNPKNYIKDVCRGNAASYYIEDGQINVYKLTDIPPGEALTVSPSSGLIGMPTQTQYGLNFRMLLNPSVKLQTMIKLENTEVNEASAQPGQQQTPLDDEWIYQAIEVTHTGDTRGNDWYTDVVGISRYGTGALPALMANSQTNANGG